MNGFLLSPLLPLSLCFDGNVREAETRKHAPSRVLIEFHCEIGMLPRNGINFSCTAPPPKIVINFADEGREGPTFCNWEILNYCQEKRSGPRKYELLRYTGKLKHRQPSAPFLLIAFWPPHTTMPDDKLVFAYLCSVAQSEYNLWRLLDQGVSDSIWTHLTFNVLLSRAVFKGGKEGGLEQIKCRFSSYYLIIGHSVISVRNL